MECGADEQLPDGSRSTIFNYRNNLSLSNNSVELGNKYWYKSQDSIFLSYWLFCVLGVSLMTNWVEYILRLLNY